MTINNQLEIELQIIPTSKQICMMCHLSTECTGCCKKCTHQCNGCQKCGHESSAESHIERLETWISIVKHPEMSRLKKFI